MARSSCTRAAPSQVTVAFFTITSHVAGLEQRAERPEPQVGGVVAVRQVVGVEHHPLHVDLAVADPDVCWNAMAAACQAAVRRRSAAAGRSASRARKRSSWTATGAGAGAARAWCGG